MGIGVMVKRQMPDLLMKGYLANKDKIIKSDI